MNRKLTTLVLIATMSIGLMAGCASKADKQLSQRIDNLEEDADKREDFINSQSKQAKKEVDRKSELSSEEAKLQKDQIDADSKAAKQRLKIETKLEKKRLEEAKKTN